jgi:hypothetical protein
MLFLQVHSHENINQLGKPDPIGLGQVGLLVPSDSRKTVKRNSFIVIIVTYVVRRDVSRYDDQELHMAWFKRATKLKK